ncbi:AGZA family xanthine/uracil permease-like MFS transporter [Clostridium acetobutylicum]|uniref:Predicted permease n=1 Tax=Clostridium acetobutylicum (strain ATCC 824 / DSM 792 / JCM 1419 / IAM 19013 / LMG 5710 / NBRC 13948 / NRRL B-527 / VKM B-1787 / 2291 / W) TaxID=272562 RepID=Q97FC0_CLOAB|nr:MULTISPECIES: NCS2 family permease [Clostridium]AAK80764.1 Predicted permease [Clostridium acetobutylicum ATCC 824]ADZ21865.1 permease [Clostridium acetobutylicum EA 2018]AEI33374.1 permease [Clostridium acetobutylicum DSM 1731]AWV78823.1 NCS2 family permease [Clostridium acetobutylicum]MBC2393688.1 NCS2 family permease [Clostridium acetobutylicum]
MLERIFKLKDRNTNVKTEIIAGLTTFMTMSYILMVQPSLMKSAGMNAGAVVVVTALLSAVCTLLMSFYTNLPFALAPAMGSNAFFAITLVKGGVVTWQEGLGMIFLSGVIFLLLTVLGLREVIVKIIPKNIKLSIGVAIGFYIVLIGFGDGNIMSIVDGSIKMGSLKSPATLLSLIGLAITIAFMANKIKGAALWSILITTLIGIPMGITKVPASLISMPPSIAPIAFKLNILSVLKLSFFPIIFTFFIGDFFSALGTILGVSSKAGLLDKDGNLENIQRPFLVDSISAILASLFGSTLITAYIESAAGVEEGGRTGLTGVITALCFLLTLFLTPIATMIPSSATAPVLIAIGLSMISGIKDIDFSDFTEAFPAFATIVFTAFTSSISNGISIGIIAYAFGKLVCGKVKELHWGIYVLCIPLVLYFVFM